MPKATQAGRNLTHGQGENLTSTVFGKKPCHVCGKQSHPWAYILHGKTHVCSKACYCEFVIERGGK